TASLPEFPGVHRRHPLEGRPCGSTPGGFLVSPPLFGAVPGPSHLPNPQSSERQQTERKKWTAAGAQHGRGFRGQAEPPEMQKPRESWVFYYRDALDHFTFACSG